MWVHHTNTVWRLRGYGLGLARGGLVAALTLSGTAAAQSSGEGERLVGNGQAAGGCVGPSVAAVVGRVQLYGSVRLDGVWEDSHLQDVEYPLWAVNEDPSQGAARNDAEFSIHPWLTRAGVRLDHLPLADGLRASAKIELDFLQQGAGWRPQLRFLHAYGRISFHHWALLIGHTDDLLSPLSPSVNAATRMWNAGNLGDRRAQFRVVYQPKVGAGRLRIATAMGVPNAVDRQDLDRDGVRDGYAAAVPMGQGLIELAGPFWTRRRPFRVGLSGHIAIQEVSAVDDASPPAGAFDYGGDRRLHAFSMVAHLQLPILDRVWLSGEGFYGQNLPDVRGGIGQAISLKTGQEVRAYGGWGQLAVEPARWFSGYVGGSIDHPVDGDVADGQRRQNATFFAANHFHPSDGLTIAIAYSYWATAYQNRGAGTAQRFNLWSAYDF